MDLWMDESVIKCVNESFNQQIDEWTDEWINGWWYEWMYGLMNGLIDGQTIASCSIYFILHSPTTLPTVRLDIPSNIISSLCPIGEDARKAESDYLKQQEMRRWVTEKMYHDEYKRVIQEVENKDHASMLHSLDATLGMSCDVMSCLKMSCHVMSCHVWMKGGHIFIFNLFYVRFTELHIVSFILLSFILCYQVLRKPKKHTYGNLSIMQCKMIMQRCVSNLHTSLTISTTYDSLLPVLVINYF